MSEEILDSINPTRMELLLLRQRLVLAQRGYDLLKDKLEALTNALFSLVDTFRETNSRVQGSINETLQKLAEVRLSLGSLRTLEVAGQTPQSLEIEARTKTHLGVPAPELSIRKIDITDFSMFLGSSGVLDEAKKVFEGTLGDVIRLAELQIAITNLAKEISNTKRRVNALNYVIIPRLQNTTQWVELVLEEQDREEFIRLKKIAAKREQLAIQKRK